MERVLEFLKLRKLKQVQRELIRLDTNEANILMYYLFNLHLINHGLSLFSLIDNCDFTESYQHPDYKVFKGFFSYGMWFDTRDKNDKELAIELLKEQEFMPYLTYMPLWYLTHEMLYLEKAVNIGIPRACLEMHEITGDFKLLKYGAKIDYTVWNRFKNGSYYFYKYSALRYYQIANHGYTTDNKVFLYFTKQDLYKKCNCNAQKAVMAFMIICKRNFIIKDIALIIVKMVWKSRKHEPEVWNFIAKKTWSEWAWSFFLKR